MRHKISGRKLNRKTSHRISMLKNLAKSLIINEQIETTLPKAKDLKPFVEKLIHSGKNNSLHSRRKVFSYLRDNNLVNKVFGVLAKRFDKRNGGYVRVLKSGFRYGDSAPKAVIELVDRDVNAKGLSDKNRIKDQKKSEEQLNSDKKIPEEKFNEDKKEKIETSSKKKSADKDISNKEVKKDNKKNKTDSSSKK